MSESRSKSTARNIKFGIINQIVTLILSFVSRTIFINILGAEYLGISSLFSDVLTMLSMADLGFGTAMAYSFYKPLAENDQNKIAALINFYKKMYNYIAIAVAVIGLSLVPFLGYIINLKNSIPYIKIYYVFFLANTVISYLFVYKASIINADQKNYLLSKYQLIINISKIIIQIIVLIIFKNFFIYLTIQILATIANNLIISNKANEIYPYISNSEYELNNKEKGSIFKNIKSIFIYKLSGVLLNSTNNTLISILIGTIWVGYYSNYNLVIVSLNNFINIIYSSVTASVGSVVITDPPKKRFEIFQSMQALSMIITSFTTVCLYVMLDNLIYVWLGSNFILNKYILASIILNFYLGGILQPIFTYREATGLYMKTKYIMLIAAIVNLILSLIMGYFWGMAGILLASVAARLTTYFWYEPKLLFDNYFNEKVRKYYLPVALNLIFTVVLIIGMEVLFSKYVVTTWHALIIKTCMVTPIILIMCLIMYRKTSGFKLILNKLEKLVKR